MERFPSLFLDFTTTYKLGTHHIMPPMSIGHCPKTLKCHLELNFKNFQERKNEKVLGCLL